MSQLKWAGRKGPSLPPLAFCSIQAFKGWGGAHPCGGEGSLLY